jgi:hypothetical protein
MSVNMNVTVPEGNGARPRERDDLLSSSGMNTTLSALPSTANPAVRFPIARLRGE